MRSVRPALVGEALRVAAADVGVVADAEPDVQPVGPVAEIDEEVPQRQRVLAAADRHQHAVARLEHVEVVDRLDHLPPAQLVQVLDAEVGVVARQVDDRRLTAHPALRCCTCRDRADDSLARTVSSTPPLMTGRTSTASASSSRVSPGTSVPLRITRWASRSSPSRRSRSPTMIGPATSTVRVGLRRATFTRFLRGPSDRTRTDWPGVKRSTERISGVGLVVARMALLRATVAAITCHRRSPPTTPRLTALTRMRRRNSAYRRRSSAQCRERASMS